jgi:transposase
MCWKGPGSSAQRSCRDGDPGSRGAAAEEAPWAATKERKQKKPPKNAPAFDMGSEWTRLLGVDLRTIDGVNIMIAQAVYTEVGPDLSAFATERHFAPWLGLTPMRSISGGKAVKAMAPYLACPVYRLMTKGQAWIDRGEAYFEQKKADREMRSLLRRAHAMGMQLVPAATVSH